MRACVYVCFRGSAPSNFVEKKVMHQRWNYNRECNNLEKRKWKYSLDYETSRGNRGLKNSDCRFCGVIVRIVIGRSVTEL